MLAPVQFGIVYPMNLMIINIMLDCKFVNEVSLYLDNPICFFRSKRFTSRQMLRYELRLKNMQNSLQYEVRDYYDKFCKLADELQPCFADINVYTYLAVALYLATYLHFDNKDSKDYYNNYKADFRLSESLRRQKKFYHYLSKRKGKKQSPIETLQSRVRIMKIVKNKPRLRKILKAKQLFCPVKLLFPLIFEKESEIDIQALLNVLD